MKLHFTKYDSLYHIFKTVKKVPTYKHVRIFIEPQHSFFSNPRWGKQIQEILQNHNIDAVFIVNTLSSKAYYENIGLSTVFKHKTIFTQIRQFFTTFLSRTKHLHSSIILKKDYISYLIVFAEIIVIISLLYLFRGLISPNATIVITPAHEIEDIVYNYQYYPVNSYPTGHQSHIRIPYYADSIEYEYNLKLNVQNISYTINNAGGTVTISNSMAESLSLIQNTKLIDANGFIFTTNKAVYVPPGTQENPGIARVTVRALPYTENGEQIGELGNLVKGAPLWIKNLQESTIQEKIMGEVTYGFTGGATLATGTVIAQDIQEIEAKILDVMQSKRKEKLFETFGDTNKTILPFDEHITLHIHEFITTSHVGDATSFIEGRIIGEIRFLYVKKDDILAAIDTYIDQRPSRNLSLLSYDIHSLTFYDITKQDNTHMFIPTKLSVVWGYNFTNDLNKLLPEVKAKITGRTKDEAVELLLKYDDVQQVDIRISPPRYDTLPQIKSRIKFRTAE